MPSDGHNVHPLDVTARAAALNRALTDRPEALIAVLTAVQAGPADTATIIARASSIPPDEVLAALRDLHAAGVIDCQPGGDV